MVLWLLDFSVIVVAACVVVDFGGGGREFVPVAPDHRGRSSTADEKRGDQHVWTAVVVVMFSVGWAKSFGTSLQR